MVFLWDIQRNILPSFNRMETANMQRSGCANYPSEKVYYFFFFFSLTLRVTFESLKYPERGSGGSSIKREDATFNNCLWNNFHCHLFSCQEKKKKCTYEK